MNKYISPTIEFTEIETVGFIMTSKDQPVSYQVKALEGVDTGDAKTAVFDASQWF